MFEVITEGHAFLSSADFFSSSSKLLFSKISFRNIQSESQIVWIQIRPDKMSGLIWFQAVCINYQRTTLAGSLL